MDAETIWIQIRHSKSFSPLCKKFSFNQKLWEVKQFMQTELQNDVTLWNIQSQQSYNSKELLKTLKELGISHDNTFMAMRNLNNTQDRVRGRIPFRSRKITPKDDIRSVSNDSKKSKKEIDSKDIKSPEKTKSKIIMVDKGINAKKTQTKSLKSSVSLQSKTPVPPKPLTSRIQIKLPNGTSKLGRFSPSSTLEAVVNELVPNFFEDRCILWTSYPRQQVKEDDFKQTLTELKMVPSISMFILLAPTISTVENIDDHSMYDVKEESLNEDVSEDVKVPEESVKGISLTDETISKSIEMENAESENQELQLTHFVDLEGKYGSMTEPSAGSTTKIQIKLVNGVTLRHNFNVNVMLGLAINHFDKLCDENLGKEIIWIAFPKMKLTADHFDKTLLELNMTPSSSLFVAPPRVKRIPSEIEEVSIQVQEVAPKETGVWTIASLSSNDQDELEMGDMDEPPPEKPPQVRMTGVMTLSSLAGPPSTGANEGEPVSKTTLIDLQIPDGTVLNHAFNKNARLHYLLSYFSEQSGVDLTGKSVHCSEIGLTTTAKDEYTSLVDLGFFPFASLTVVEEASQLDVKVIADESIENVDKAESIQDENPVPTPAPASVPTPAPSPVSTQGAVSQDVPTSESQPGDNAAIQSESTDISNEVTPEAINAMIARVEEIARASAAMKRERKQAAGTSDSGNSGSGSSEAGPSTATEMTIEEKTARAKLLLEKERMAKQEAAKEAAKQQEKERRELGQTILEQKRRKEELEMVKTANTLKQDKLVQKREMEAIRQQIARDKAERRGETYTPPPPDPTIPAPPTLPEGKVLINIKFPATEAAIRRTFDENQTLSDVVEYVKNEVQRENFTLWNTFPRKQFKSPDLDLTLRSLQLTGTVSLLGMSGKGYTPTPASTPAVQSEAVPTSTETTAKEKPLEQTRIQFKKADGSSLLHLFDKETKLVEVIKYFQSQCQDLGDSVLWSLYPRYEISHDHINQTLEELEMCPSAVIFVVPPQEAGPVGQVGIRASSFVWGVMLTLIQLPISVLQYLKDILFPRTPPVRPRPPPLTPPGGGEAAQRVPAFRAEDNDNNSERSTVRRRTKLDGNVTRLSNEQPDTDEDDTNTWNGNSTELQ